MANEFAIVLDHKNSKRKYIVCEAKGLHIEVLSRHFDLRQLPPTALIISAAFYDKSLPAEEMLHQVKELHFKIADNESPYKNEWRMPLFFDAIDFYCKDYIKAEHDGLSYVPGPKWYPFEIDENDDLQCLIHSDKLLTKEEFLHLVSLAPKFNANNLTGNAG